MTPRLDAAGKRLVDAGPIDTPLALFSQHALNGRSVVGRRDDPVAGKKSDRTAVDRQPFNVHDMEFVRGE